MFHGGEVVSLLACEQEGSLVSFRTWRNFFFFLPIDLQITLLLLPPPFPSPLPSLPQRPHPPQKMDTSSGWMDGWIHRKTTAAKTGADSPTSKAIVPQNIEETSTTRPLQHVKATGHRFICYSPWRSFTLGWNIVVYFWRRLSFLNSLLLFFCLLLKLHQLSLFTFISCYRSHFPYILYLSSIKNLNSIQKAEITQESTFKKNPSVLTVVVAKIARVYCGCTD